ncbi:Cyn operon transcriptional activator [Variovorax sp. PBS-H4]|uniref:LysR family transcriptional regulator n=1 Tax=Variovorax sp. PBS-H4 TaxID=434008 RepID=UPI001317C461|nr:LysR family transcriptional regulator [Variovorax sp. PBS-H4]VTU41273.1 Cyn operon transcriptional activator [Variovorax sp. PBS-H4]
MDFSRSDISTFLEVVRSGSLSRAAANIGLTQPSVSKALRRLEDEAGVPLLERGIHGAKLTNEGELFHETARRYEAQHFELVRMASELRARHSGLLRIGITSPGESNVVHAMSELVRRRPAVRLQLRIGKSDELNSAVEDGLLDMAIAPAYPGQHWSCTQLSLAEEDSRLVARVQHPLASNPDLTLADLTPYPWVMASQNSAARQLLNSVFQRNHQPVPHVALEVDYMSEAALEIISSTDLLALVRAPLLRGWLGRVMPLSLSELHIKRSVVLLTRPDAKWSHLMVEFRGLLLDAARPRRR